MIIILLCIENNKTKILPPCFADFTRLLFGNSTNVESAEIQTFSGIFLMIIFTRSLLDSNGKLKLHDEKKLFHTRT